MRIYFYTISLLLSFFISVSHEFIPHHHHESFALEISVNQNQPKTQSHDQSDKHHHHSEKTHNHHDQTSKKADDDHEGNHHENDFPIHYHLSGFNLSDFTRLSHSESNRTINVFQLYLISDILHNKFFIPPENHINSYFSKSRLLQCISIPEGNPLRGPPFVA